MREAAPGIPRTALPFEVMRAALEAVERGQRAVLATVVARHGSTPSTPGQKLALLDDRTAIGTIGGGAVERVVLAAMVKALSGPPPDPRIETFRLGASLGMCCGGSVDILIEPLVPTASALLVGAGHVGVFLAPLLASLGFRVVLCDAREEAMDPARLRLVGLPSPSGRETGEDTEAPAADAAGSGNLKLLHAEHDDPEVASLFPRPAEAVALVMTHDHKLDQTAIEWAIERGFGFVGGVGSRAKAARTRARLEMKGTSPADIERVRMPVGIDIAARTPAEIGVAIAAELIAWRAAQTRASLTMGPQAAPNPSAQVRASLTMEPQAGPNLASLAMEPQDSESATESATEGATESATETEAPSAPGSEANEPPAEPLFAGHPQA
jgi:xanthine dehydrogenase accessory factor